MKKSLFAFASSALLALAVCLPVVVHADSDTDKLNARLRAQTRATGSMPDLSKLPKPHLPNKALRAVYLVETNRKGQVVKVRAGKPSPSESFNDYTPSTQMIKRDVELVQKGGVNADAPGAVTVMERRSAAAEAKLHK